MTRTGSKVRIWIAVGCGGLLVLGILVVGGVRWLIDQAMEEFAEQVAADLADDPVIVEHLGEILEIEVDWDASVELAETDVFLFDVRATKDEGRVRAKCVTIDVDTEDVVSGVLVLPDGTTFWLTHD